VLLLHRLPRRVQALSNELELAPCLFVGELPAALRLSRQVRLQRSIALANLGRTYADEQGEGDEAPNEPAQSDP
jgi:hypothetical protein